MTAPFLCWCGGREAASTRHEAFVYCRQCGAGQLKRLGEHRAAGKVLEFSHVYSADYWDQHMTRQGYPTIAERARLDLHERCCYWLAHLLKYRRPPARVLEIGCAHGGSVKLMRLAGFDAMGLEMDADIVANARAWFGIDVIQGPIESAGASLGRFDAIVMHDVIEHFPDPRATLACILGHLNPDGVLAVQTPQFHPDKPPDWKHFLPVEHTFLYDQASVKSLLEQVGFKHVAFEPAIFDEDMYLFASPAPLAPADQQTIAAAMLERPDSRMALALLDSYDKWKAASRFAVDPIRRYGLTGLVWHGLRAISHGKFHREPRD